MVFKKNFMKISNNFFSKIHGSVSKLTIWLKLLSALRICLRYLEKKSHAIISAQFLETVPLNLFFILWITQKRHEIWSWNLCLSKRALAVYVTLKCQSPAFISFWVISLYFFRRIIIITRLAIVPDNYDKLSFPFIFFVQYHEFLQLIKYLKTSKILAQTSQAIHE